MGQTRMTPEERREKRAAYSREYYKKNREALLRKKYHKECAQLDRIRDLQCASATRRQRYLKSVIFEKYGNRCAHCGFDNPLAFQIDHVHGGGTQDVLKYPSKWAYLKAVIADDTGKFQLLCANCNQIKRNKNGEHRKAYKRGPPRWPLGGEPSA